MRIRGVSRKKFLLTAGTIFTFLGLIALIFRELASDHPWSLWYGDILDIPLIFGYTIESSIWFGVGLKVVGCLFVVYWILRRNKILP